ncbi:MAG: hypothetical protein GY757_08650, partial [bacterium]|nr:hypothetical protein [bacterium]
NPSLVYISSRYGYNAVDEDDNLILNKFDPMVWFNLYLKCDDLFVKGLEVGLGVYNLFAREYRFIQPYMDGYHAPFPEPSREFIFSAAYSFNFK